MNGRRVLSLVGTLLLLCALLPLSVAARPAQQDSLTKVEALVLQRLAASDRTDLIVRMAEQADLSPAYSMNWNDRGWFVYNTLRQTAARTQAGVIRYLEGKGVRYQSFIAGNEVYVYDGTLEMVLSLAARPEVGMIYAPQTYYVDPIVEDAPLAPEALDWGIVDTKADQFWSAFGKQGEGIVVANIDTGVQWNHPALDQAYKCGTNPSDPACWSDPSNICGGSMCDNNGHGTHTMGTMVGDDDPSLQYQVGMAPSAQWIACKGCESSSCSTGALNACADWILAPGGNPNNRPHVVNNSWGGNAGTCNTWYQAKVQAWRAAGIFPAFSAGNSGSSCTTLGVPAVYQESFASAAHDSSRAIASFSSRGPAPTTAPCHPYIPYTKPNISAPGVNICSSVPTNSWSCGYSGTSMASPHSAGAVALLWSCNPSLIGQIDQTFEIFQNNANTPPAGNCGAPPAPYGGNYTFGYGYLDVYAAGLQWCGDIGYIAGTVYDAVTMTPIAGAEVYAVPSVQQKSVDVPTDPNGHYTLTLAVGTYDVYVEHPLYTTAMASGIVVTTDTVTPLDLYMQPRGRLFGYVTDYDNGFPIEGAVVTAEDGTFDETDEAGYYEMYLDEGTYAVTATAQNYAPDYAIVEIISGADTQQDFALRAVVSFIPSPLHVTVEWQSLYNTTATVLNRLPTPYAFEFQEIPGGFKPLLAQRPQYPLNPSVVPSIPLTTGIPPAGYLPTAGVSGGTPQGPWQARAAAPTVSMDNVYLDYEHKGYLLGGYGFTGGVAIYDADANSWTTGAAEPAPRIQYPVDGCLGLNASGEPVGILFNDTTSGATTLHRYNMATNAWDTPPVPAGFPSNGLWAHDVVSLLRFGGRNVCYISGGATTPGGGNTSALYEYHPDTNTVVNLGNFSHLAGGFDFHASWYVPWIGNQGAICVGGGVNSGSQVTANTQCYDIGAGVFNPVNADLGPLPAGVWGMADGVLYENGDYQLWIANGADAAFALWPNSAYYSHNDGQWHIGPVPPTTVYRVEGTNIAASDGCSFYVVGGSSGGFTPTSGHNRNFSASCPPTAGAECLWLGEVPTSTVVPAQSAFTPTMLFTATFDVGVDQPGDYYCKLNLQGNPAVQVLVTMTVLPGSNMGRVHGYVLDNCTGAPVKANIAIENGDPITQTQSDKDTGYYSFWLVEGTYNVTFSAGGYLDYDAVVDVPAGGDVVLDVDLVPNRPCIAVAPASFEVWVVTGTQELRTQTLTNGGGQSLDYEYVEKEGGYTPGLLLNPIVPALGTTGPIPGWDESDTPPPDLYATLPTGIVPDTWGEGTLIPSGAQYQGASATIDNENFYLFGGYSTTYLNQCLHYNTASGSWTPCTPMSMARGNIHAYYNPDDGKIYVPGGYNGSYLNINEVYDPEMNSWTTLTPLPIAKSGADGCIVDNKMYLFGGNGGTAYNETQIYDIAQNTWSTGTPMPITTHRYGDGVTYEGKCYVIGGYGESGFFRYDPANNSWQTGPSLTVPRNSPNCTVTPDGIIYCWGGGDGWTARNNGEYYNLANWPGGSWTPINDDPIPYGTVRGGHICAVDRLWIEGGAPSPYHNHNQWWEGLGMTCYWPFGEVPDVPWVWEDPVTGTVAPQSAFDVEIGFTSWYVSGTETIHLPLGTYTATLEIKNNDAVAGKQTVPLTMHIVAEFIAPTADFASNSPVCFGEEVVFTNLTQPGVPPITTYLWDFGDGEFSTEENPTHLYGEAGIYTVTLTACNSENMCDTAEGQVEVRPLPEAGFTYAVDELTVAFTDTSQNATAYLWDFGDGITDTVPNPVHTYAAEGTYTVTQWVFNDCGADIEQQQVTVGVAPAASFLATSPVCLGEPTVFTNTTTGTPPITYLWAFGDGITDTVENPVHTYAAPGPYTVTLDAANAFGSSRASGVVEVLPLPTAGFTYTIVEGVVTFVNQSQNATSWLWAFGDGITSTLENPVHTYTAEGTYTVTLWASGPCGTAEAGAELEIRLCDAAEVVTVTTQIEGCVVTFGAEVVGDEPFSYLWDFGAFGTSTETNPVVNFQATGTYTGTLTVSNCAPEPAVATFSVAVECALPRYYIYVPLVLKGYTVP